MTSVKLYLGLSALLPPTVLLPTANRRLSSYRIPADATSKKPGISNYRLHAYICYRPHPRSSFNADPHPPNPSGQNYQAGKSHNLDFLLILTLLPFPTAGFQTTASMLTYVIDRTPAGFQTTASMLTYVIDRTPGHHLMRTRTRQIPLVKITKPRDFKLPPPCLHVLPTTPLVIFWCGPAPSRCIGSI
ncbi:hypothetical protein Fcan01_05434 [Folsomia candida]|uniref:Uncharacterized protein n=1 Tax=Folsomia candida TaxID=158441 RepID=A0A226EQM1_FOLCA|nr:hypothetical protein Fcan01_05434 [Folsomia candida]